MNFLIGFGSNDPSSFCCLKSDKISLTSSGSYGQIQTNQTKLNGGTVWFVGKTKINIGRKFGLKTVDFYLYLGVLLYFQDVCQPTITRNKYKIVNVSTIDKGDSQVYHDIYVTSY